MRAALYCRISSDMQIDNFSIAAQINELNRYCLKEGIEIYKVYSDEGFSGTKEERPQFQAMLKDADHKLFDIILVHKYDRFARNVELSQKVKKKLKKTKIALISITEPLEDSPMGFFVGGLHELMNEYYSRNLSNESKKGHIQRAREGLHNGSVPFGYMIDKLTGDMVINKDQAAIVCEIFRMYNYEGYGSTKIAIWLNSVGVKTAVEGRWAHQPVNKILKNVKYIGKIYYDGEVYEGKHDPIISEDEFNLTQRYMTERTWKREYRGANYAKYLFVGLLKCGYCKKSMLIHVAKERRPNRKNIDRPYYKCSRHTHSDSIKKCDDNKCHPFDSLENNIIDFIRGNYTVINPEKIETLSSVTSVLKDRKGEAQKELDRLLQLVIKGYITDDKYNEEKIKIENELKIIELNPSPNKNLIKEMATKIESLMQQFDLAEDIPTKKSILKKFIKNIYVYKNDIDIDFVL